MSGQEVLTSGCTCARHTSLALDVLHSLAQVSSHLSIAPRLSRRSFRHPSRSLVILLPHLVFFARPRGYLVRPCTNSPPWCKVVPLSCARLFA